MSSTLVEDNWKIIFLYLDRTSLATLKFVNTYFHKLVNKLYPNLHYDLEDIVYHNQYDLLNSHIKPLIGMPVPSQNMIMRLSYLAGYCDPITYSKHITEGYFHAEACLNGIYMRGNIEWEKWINREYRMIWNINVMLRSRSIEFTAYMMEERGIVIGSTSLSIAGGYSDTRLPYVNEIDRKYNIKPPTSVHNYLEYIYSNNNDIVKGYVGTIAADYDLDLLKRIVKLGFIPKWNWLLSACSRGNFDVVKYMVEAGFGQPYEKLETGSLAIYKYLKNISTTSVNEYESALYASGSNDYEEFMRTQHAYGVRLPDSIFIDVIENSIDFDIVGKISLLLELGYVFPPNIYYQVYEIMGNWESSFLEELMKFLITHDATWSEYTIPLICRFHRTDLLQFVFETHNHPIPTNIREILEHWGIDIISIYEYFGQK